MENNKTSENKKQPFSDLFDWVSSLIVALVAVVVVFTLFFRIVSVDGHSMDDTLSDGERLVLVTTFYHIDRGDVVVIYRKGEEPLIKRVVALAGDTVDVNDETGKVILNGKEIDEPFVKGGITVRRDLPENYTVPEGCVFAMGDNRSDSLDSRILGPFTTDQILGVVAWRLWPLKRLI